MSSESKIPSVRVGDWVSWHEGGERESKIFPAIVLQENGNQSLYLGIIRPMSMTLMLRDACMHVDSPRGAKENVQEEGRWSEGPQRLENQELRARVEALETKLGELLAVVNEAEAAASA